MKTICSVHAEIEKSFSDIISYCNTKVRIYEDDLESLQSAVEEYQNILSSIESLADNSDVKEARDMGQTMEDGLKRRKDFMEEHKIEQKYQLTKK